MCCITVTYVITFDMKYFLLKYAKWKRMEERMFIARFSIKFEVGGEEKPKKTCGKGVTCKQCSLEQKLECLNRTQTLLNFGFFCSVST